MNKESGEPIPFSSVLSALQNASVPFPARYLRSFSDLPPANLKVLLNCWPSIPARRKVSLLEDLEAVLEEDTLVNFDNLARALLADPDPHVRTCALRLLWECEEKSILPILVDISIKDEDETTRETAISLLGK
ncbi:MAG TPA: HEAT repeat domain-containing protein, partial [Anaerolineaceae bacterium]|nr:HEAT repeat domain-containing protein [Anaerolineaceae bacterium]